MMGAGDSAVVADEFWKMAGGRALYGRPVRIECAAPRVLPVAVRRIAGLHTGAVSELLARIGAPPWMDGSPRSLRGCLIADAGKALIFVDADDPDDEQRMTVAHEVAHLLVHYLQPRRAAVTAFGKDIVAVLDRLRPPHLGERFSAALRSVPIEPYRHAMDRNAATRREVSAMEDQADDLAVELLVPWNELHAIRGASPGARRERFGVPAAVATRLAVLAAPSRTTSGVLGMFGQK